METSTNFKPIQDLSKSQRVFEAIKDAIFEGKLEPGTPLRELVLAKQLEVSQSTIREALMQLQKYGLALKVRNKGTTVTKLTKKEVEERIRVRSKLEEFAWKTAAKYMNEDDYQKLFRMLDDITEGIHNNEYYKVERLDLNFHRFIWEKSQNKMLYEVLDQLTLPLFAFISVQRSKSAQVLEKNVDSHANIVKALQSKDDKTIEKINQKHTLLSYANIENRFPDIR
jgi:DNA-binding GntR family transcriptional regulator